MRQLQGLPSRLGSLPMPVKAALAVAVLALVAAGSLLSASSGETYQYAFTNLTAEDSAEAAGRLQASGIPFRLEAGGSALAVPAGKVHDARLLLAAAGIPRGGGVGFELFDKGDLGVSEFTQRVNLRRATEGELARTISRLAPVRAARVHVTLPEKTLFREDARKASAAVVLTLQPGRVLGEGEVAGIRHLVASAVPGLAHSDVTLVDGRGAVLSETAAWGASAQYERKLERDLEQRIVGILEQAVGAGAVVARVTASVDASEVTESAERVDPDTSALRSERTVTQSSSQDASAAAGIAGAAANQPLAPAGAAQGPVSRGASSMTDEVRNYDVSRTQTTTVTRAPRLTRLSVAVLVDGVDGKPRAEADVRRLGELAKAAVGFDAARGDELDISSSPFVRSDDAAAEGAEAATAHAARPAWQWQAAAGGAALLLLALVALALSRRRPRSARQEPAVLLTPGATVAQLEAAAERAAGALPAPVQIASPGAPKDPLSLSRERARALAAEDPNRTANIIKHWMREGEGHGA